MDAKLDAALVAFQALKGVQDHQIVGAAIRDHYGDEALSVVVNYGIKGSKHFVIPLSELEAVEFTVEEPAGPDQDRIIVLIPSEEPDPESEAEQPLTVDDLMGIDRVSAPLAQAILDAGYDTWDKLENAAESGELTQVGGIGGVTLARIRLHFNPELADDQ